MTDREKIFLKDDQVRETSLTLNSMIDPKAKLDLLLKKIRNISLLVSLNSNSSNICTIFHFISKKDTPYDGGR